jgi:D-arginine utilization repressor
MKAHDDNLHQLCIALHSFLAPFGEIVIHDLETETIARIAGNLSNRKVGDPSFLDELGAATASTSVFGPYSKTNPDGRLVKSISVVFRDNLGRAVTLFCINLDASHFEQARAALSMFVNIPEVANNPFADDWLDHLNRYVAEWCMTQGVSNTRLSPHDRLRLLRVLKDKGVFDRPKAADAVAAALSVSRATVYQGLKEL